MVLHEGFSVCDKRDCVEVPFPERLGFHQNLQLMLNYSMIERGRQVLLKVTPRVCG